MGIRGKMFGGRRDPTAAADDDDDHNDEEGEDAGQGAELHATVALKAE